MNTGTPSKSSLNEALKASNMCSSSSRLRLGSLLCFLAKVDLWFGFFFLDALSSLGESFCTRTSSSGVCAFFFFACGLFHPSCPQKRGRTTGSRQGPRRTTSSKVLQPYEFPCNATSSERSCFRHNTVFFQAGNCSSGTETLQQREEHQQPF